MTSFAATAIDPAGAAAADRSGCEDRISPPEADALGMAVAHSTAEAVALIRRGVRLVVHPDNLRQIRAAVAKRARKAAARG